MIRVFKKLCISSLVFITGCQLTPTFTTGYNTQHLHAGKTISGDSLAIIRFEDERQPRVYSTQGKIFLTYIPLIPYVSLPFERLEESIDIQSRAISSKGAGTTMGAEQNVAPELAVYYYPNSFPQAISEDLKTMGLFNKVEFIDKEPAETFRYQLAGKILATPLNQSVTSYGLGMPGVLLWFLPLPMAKTSASITVDLTLTDLVNGKVIWQHRLNSEISRYLTLYTSSAMVYGRSAFSFNLVPPPSDAQVDNHSLFSWHFEALRQAMEIAKPLLMETIVEHGRSI